MTSMQEGQKRGSFPVIARYPEWSKACPERGHKRVPATVYKGMLIHRWALRIFCVTPFSDTAGAFISLPEDIYESHHPAGANRTRCHEAETFQGALAFVDALWAPAEQAMGLRR